MIYGNETVVLRFFWGFSIVTPVNDKLVNQFKIGSHLKFSSKLQLNLLYNHFRGWVNFNDDCFEKRGM